MSENLQKWQQLHERFSSHTMVWAPVFWENLDLCARHHQPGLAVVECGVWKGGMIAAIAAALNDPAAQYHLFDSFQGLPDAQEVDGSAARAWQAAKDSPIYYDNCTASLEDARAAMALSGADPAQVRFHPGWFADTLAAFRCDRPISILRLDADWYAGTLLCLEKLYPLVAEGGLVIIDDYYTWAGCSRAVHDYLAAGSLPVRIRHTPHDVAYFLKQSEG